MTSISAIAFDFRGTLFSTAKMRRFDMEMKSIFIHQIQADTQ